ncbi:MAG: anti-sigma factor [Acidimicrobiales bacterium]
MSAEELELEELLGAYALDAVSDDERRAVEQFLAVNPRARQEVAEHREVATVLAWTGMSAPDGLWDRIAANLDQDATAAPRPSGELASVISMTDRESRRARRWRSAGSWLAATAAAAVVAVIAVTALNGDDTDQAPLAAAVDDARSDSDSVSAWLVNGEGDVGAEVVIDQEGHGYVIADALPALPADRTYQLWGVIGDQVISLGVLGSNPHVESFSAGGETVAQVVVTIEAAGGVVSNGNPEGAYAGTLG